jgi:hypothetical protein
MPSECSEPFRLPNKDFVCISHHIMRATCLANLILNSIIMIDTVSGLELGTSWTRRTAKLSMTHNWRDVSANGVVMEWWNCQFTTSHMMWLSIMYKYRQIKLFRLDKQLTAQKPWLEGIKRWKALTVQLLFRLTSTLIEKCGKVKYTNRYNSVQCTFSLQSFLMPILLLSFHIGIDVSRGISIRTCRYNAEGKLCLRSEDVFIITYGSKSLVRSTGSAVWNF